MRLFIKIVLFLLLPFLVAGQDTTITISPGMMKSNVFSLGKIDGWLFKKGNDTSWTGKDINVSEWQKLKPSELSEKLTDKNGRLEGWFRIKIKLDPAFRDTILDIYMNVWAASDVYMDGKLFYTFGNTGANGKPFTE